MKGECLVKEIQMKNFRSLKDTGMQKLSPITILVGENSSGKSTFLRAFPLLKQSISKRTSGPILWAGDVDDYVDFGSFEETVTNNGANEITFSFNFSIGGRDNQRVYYSTDEFGERIPVTEFKNNIHYEMTIGSSNGRDFVSVLSIEINNTNIDFNLIDKSVRSGDLLYIDNTSPRTSAIISTRNRKFFSYSRALSRSFEFSLPSIEALWEEFAEMLPLEFDDIGTHMLVNICADIGEILTFGKAIPLDKSKIRNSSPRYCEYYNKIVDIVNMDNSGRMADVLRILFVYRYFTVIDEYIYTYFKQVHYIAPLRATAERYYRLRNLAVDEVDYQGKNLPIYINSLTPKRLKAFQHWTNEHFGFSVVTGKSKGHLSLNIELKGSDKRINLSDTGFGYSQVLPIITQLWDLATQPRFVSQRYWDFGQPIPLIIAIEQPELHLHPAIQARLAKAFIACINLARENRTELQLIIETHSETIVNYFGRAIARHILNPDDISVIIFDKKAGDSITAVQNCNYNKYGMLTNWPYGFFESEE